MNEAKTEAFKVEVLQDYYALDKGPSLDAWLAGDHQQAISIMEQDGPNQWCLDYGKKTINKVRIHIVEEPYTPYIEWELEIYRRVLIPSTKEQISLVPKSTVQSLELPDGDFWIFDDKRVVRYHYKDTKTYQGDVYDEGDDISQFLTLKTELLKLVQPIE